MKSYRFETNCVDSSDGAAIRSMVEAGRQISRGTFLRYVEREHLWEVERTLHYDRWPRQGLTMAKDWHVAYFRSCYLGRPCVYFVHSAIEWVFTGRTS